MEYDPETSMTTFEAYDPVNNWSVSGQEEKWSEYVPATAPTQSAQTLALDMAKILKAASDVVEVSKRIEEFISHNKKDVFDMSSYHVLKKLGISTTLANKKFAHSEIRKYQLETLNMDSSDILKAFHLSKSAKREDIQRAVAEYKNTYNLSVKWAIKMSGHKRTIGGMLLAMYLIDEALESERRR